MKKEPNFYYVYLITNLALNNKQYVGSRMCYAPTPNEDIYWGSSKYLNEDYEIYGKDKFIKEIITTKYTNVKDMLDGETEYILKYNTLAPNGYNRFLPNRKNGFHGGGNIGYWKGKKQSEETIEKRRQKLIGKKCATKTKDKIRKTLTGVKHTDERRKHISESHIGQIPWNKNKKCGCFSGENNGMYGISVYNLWIEKYGLEEANKRKELRKQKSSASLKGKNKDKKHSKKICPHCNKEIDISNFNKWHGDNCKNKIKKMF